MDIGIGIKSPSCYRLHPVLHFESFGKVRYLFLIIEALVGFERFSSDPSMMARWFEADPGIRKPSRPVLVCATTENCYRGTFLVSQICLVVGV